MGVCWAKVSVLETLSDLRIDKCQKRLGFTDPELTSMYSKFNAADSDGMGFIGRPVFFEKILKENRTAFGDSVCDLIDPKTPLSMTFGEFVDTCSAFCLFEEDDIIKLCFKMLDPDMTGFVDKDVVRFFIYQMHDEDQGSNIERALEFLEKNDDGDGRFEYYQILQMHKNFQQLFYPCFRLQISLQRIALGERWWENKKFELDEKRAEKRRIEEAKAKEASEEGKAESAAQKEKMVQQRMGVLYYLMIWERPKYRRQVERLNLISSELEAATADADGDDDDDDDDGDG